MPILLFLIDTSASMNQRSHLGTTYLDTAKGAVETFMKVPTDRARRRRPRPGSPGSVPGTLRAEETGICGHFRRAALCYQ
ncbi:Integrator complex subunit 6, partial [Camelus dromedarius]